ncbi:MAG: DUF3109 family protein [Prevotellaceae bacterium]|jgi:hypothetical protein|nr:DUF3109 family protein [Prevotellaceae bacterium]
MLEINDTVVSLDLFKQFFLCDLNSCRGICCVDGDSGAPLEPDEVGELERVLPAIWNDISTMAQEVITKQGVAYRDIEGDMVTSLVDGRECVFTCTDADGICRCAIEKAFREGRIDFYKPISCHLYPVRLTKYQHFTAVNYHQWHICTCAKQLGKKSNVPLYRFLEEPLTRRFGKAWYGELEQAALAYKAEFLSGKHG